MFIRFITTGGTIDKIYFDALSQFEVGESVVQHILTDGLVDFEYDVVPMFQKDSLEITDADRDKLRDYIASDDVVRCVI
ncbi:MAG: asparaginase, partial [Pseudomonadota bacterium]